MSGNARIGALGVGVVVLILAAGFLLGRSTSAPAVGRGPSGGAGVVDPRSTLAAGTRVPADVVSGPGATRTVPPLPSVPGAKTSESHASPIPAAGEGRRAKLADLVADLRDALRTGDADALGRLVERIASWIGQDLPRALEIAALLQDEADPQIATFLVEALKANPVAAHDPSVAEALLAVARTGKQTGARVAALGFLAGGALPDDRMVPAVLDLTRGEADPHVRGLGANLLTASLERKPGEAAQVYRFLTDLARNDPFEDIRGAVLQSLPLRHADAQTLETVGTILAADTARGVRATAALALGDPPREQTARAVELLTGSLDRERDEEVRRTAVTSIVRAQREEALPLLERLATAHPDLKQHIDDFRQILGTGETDIDRIWEAKQKLEFGRAAPDHDHSAEATD